MKTFILTTVFLMAASPAFAKEYTIKEVTDYDAKKQFFFSPDKLTIQPGDTVKFVNAQDEIHDVMFINVPNQVDEMIMSPSQEKKGDTFSYTFTVPGTYKFHCHAHEQFGMEGTLIVGTASKAGETKSMDHHKLSKKLDDNSAPAAGGDVVATGQIVSVDAESSTVKIKHDPIKELNWPKMTMSFTASKGVDLSGIKAGDNVSFTLKAEGKDDYVISGVTKK